jgi:hypothetical protein
MSTVFCTRIEYNLRNWNTMVHNSKEFHDKTNNNQVPKKILHCVANTVLRACETGLISLRKNVLGQ